GASMPAMARRTMAPPSVRRNPLRWLGRWFGRRQPRQRPAPRKRQSLLRVLRLRQCLLALLVFLPAIGATAYMATVLPHGGSTWLELVILAAALLLFAWILVGFWTALCGFGVLCSGGRYRISSAGGDSAQQVGHTRTAIVMPIYEEDVARAFAGVQAAYESIAATGRLDEFDF